MTSALIDRLVYHDMEIPFPCDVTRAALVVRIPGICGRLAAEDPWNKPCLLESETKAASSVDESDSHPELISPTLPRLRPGKRKAAYLEHYDYRSSSSEPRTTPTVPNDRYFTLHFPPAGKKAVKSKGRQNFKERIQGAYVFGAGQKDHVDLRLPGPRQGCTSTSRQHFAVKLHEQSNIWVLDNLAINPISVNGIVLPPNGAQPSWAALHPEAWTAVKMTDLTLFLYPGNPSNLDYLEKLRPGFLPPVGDQMTTLSLRSSTRSSTRTQVHSLPEEVDHRMAIYELKQTFDVQSTTHTCLTLNPLTLQFAVAKLYGKDDDSIRWRYNLLSTIDEGNEKLIVKYLHLVETSRERILLTSWLPQAITLERYLDFFPDPGYDIGPVAVQKLLINLLLILTTLEARSIVHNDISCRTILVNSLDEDGADVALTGFSNCKHIQSPTDRQGSHASSQDDCQAAFRVAARCLDNLKGNVVSVGHQLLDLHTATINQGDRAGIPNASELCKDLDLRGRRKVAWRSLNIQRMFHLGMQQVAGEMFVRQRDVAEFIRPRGAQENPTRAREIRALMKLYLATGEDYISLREVERDCRHFGATLSTSFHPLDGPLEEQVTSTTSGLSLALSRTFTVMTHLPSRMFNITQLLSIASDQIATAVIDDTTLQIETQELRGSSSLEGRYADMTMLDKMLERLVLENNTLAAEMEGWSSQDDFSTNDSIENIVVGDRLLMGVALMNRRTRQITWNGQPCDEVEFSRHCSSPGTMFATTNLSTLESSSHWSDFQTYKPEDLASTATATQNAVSVTSSDSEDDLRFKFTARSRHRINRSETTAKWVNSLDDRQQREVDPEQATGDIAARAFQHGARKS